MTQFEQAIIALLTQISEALKGRAGTPVVQMEPAETLEAESEVPPKLPVVKVKATKYREHNPSHRKFILDDRMRAVAIRDRILAEGGNHDPLTRTHMAIAKMLGCTTRTAQTLTEQAFADEQRRLEREEAAAHFNGDTVEMQ